MGCGCGAGQGAASRAPPPLTGESHCPGGCPRRTGSLCPSGPRAASAPRLGTRTRGAHPLSCQEPPPLHHPPPSPAAPERCISEGREEGEEGDGLGYLPALSAPHPWGCPWPGHGTLTADLGTAAVVGGLPLLLVPTVSVSVCSILERFRGSQGVCVCRGDGASLPSALSHPLEGRPTATLTSRPSHLVVVGTEVFEVSKADMAETDDDGDDQDDKGEHGCGGQEPCCWGHI